MSTNEGNNVIQSGKEILKKTDSEPHILFDYSHDKPVVKFCNIYQYFHDFFLEITADEIHLFSAPLLHYLSNFFLAFKPLILQNSNPSASSSFYFQHKNIGYVMSLRFSKKLE